MEMFVENRYVFVDEVNLNFRIIFPMLNALSKCVNNMVFLPGETRLKAVTSELELLLIDHVHFYNADTTIALRKPNIEIVFLETTGKLNVKDKPKEARDYVKAGYGLVSLLHTIGHLYKYADFNIFK